MVLVPQINLKVKKVKMTLNVRRFALVLAGTMVCGLGEARAGLVITAEAHGVQATTVAGVTTESFNAFTPGIYSTPLNTAIGQITSPGAAIVAHDQYGGAGGIFNYIAVGAQSHTTTMTLTLANPESYFGFWWSAADSQNSIAFYSGGSLLATFNPTTALGALSSDYLGNPNGGDGGEKFAYLNIFGNNGTTIDKIVFNNQSTGSGFEADNFSIRASEVTPPPGNTPIVGGLTVATPEPSTMAAAVVGGFIGVAALRRRKKA